MPPKRKASGNNVYYLTTPKKLKRDGQPQKSRARQAKSKKKSDGAIDTPSTVEETEEKLKKGKSVKMAAAGNADLKLSSWLTDGEWLAQLKSEFEQDYFKTVESKLQQDFQKGLQVFPAKENIFRALNLTPLSKVKVIILGQDPYHDDNQATGLAFSVPRGEKVPPSLKNMYKELEEDIPGFSSPSHGCLDAWADAGVLLLNNTLTVEAHKANSHKSYGWGKFTDSVIQAINNSCSGVVFLLWGNFAQKKGKLVDSKKHFVYNSAHPSPLSFNKFKGCRCFSKANELLKQSGKTPVDWKLPA